MKTLLKPKILVPLILSAAVIAALLAFADLGKVLRQMENFNRLDLLFFLLLMVVYEGIRGLQWHFLLKSLDIHAPLKSQWFAFLVGEMAKSLPIGNYVQNYLLQRSQGEDFGRSSSASTLIIITEVFVSVVGVLILGVGSWSGWLRVVIVVGSVVVGLIVFFIVHQHRSGEPPQWITSRKALRAALGEFNEFKHGAADLLMPRILLIETLLSASYLLVAGAALYIVVLGLHIGNVSFFDTLSIYFFSLAFSLILPIPIDIGVLELSGVGAFLAVGATKSAAVSAMLINRVLSIGSALVIALIAMAVWHDELRAAMRDRPARQGSAPNDPEQPGARPPGEVQPSNATSTIVHT